MEENRKIIDEQVERLQKQIATLKRRNSILKKCNYNLTVSNQDLNTQLRAESRVHDKLANILFIETYEGYYNIRVLLNWVQEIALDNEKLREEKKMLHPFKRIETSRVKLMFSEN